MKKKSDKRAPHLKLKPRETPYTKVHSDLTRVRKMSDKDIEEQVKDNPDAAPLMEWPESVEVSVKSNKVPISLRVDSDVLEFFKDQGPGHLSRMNAVLRAYVENKRKKAA